MSVVKLNRRWRRCSRCVSPSVLPRCDFIVELRHEMRLCRTTRLLRRRCTALSSSGRPGNAEPTYHNARRGAIITDALAEVEDRISRGRNGLTLRGSRVASRSSSSDKRATSYAPRGARARKQSPRLSGIYLAVFRGNSPGARDDDYAPCRLYALVISREISRFRVKGGIPRGAREFAAVRRGG